MKPYQPSVKIAVRDSLDEDFSDDVEDEVFIRDGKMSRTCEENGLKRPLMAPRRKKHKLSTPVSKLIKKKVSRWKCWTPLLYGCLTILILLIVILFTVAVISFFSIEKIKIWEQQDYELFRGELIPCSQINVHKKWSKAFSKMVSESAVRKCFVNDDDIEDIIIGYGIDDNFQYDDESMAKCPINKNGQMVSCQGGIIALDGKNGNTLWQRWTIFNVFSLYCTQDINNDKRNDCIVAGRSGLIIAIDGRQGELIWQLQDDMLELKNEATLLIDLYTINSVRDLNNDNIQDVLAVHVEERETSRASHIKIICGKSGKVIRTIPTPYMEEVFVPVQLFTWPDGTEYLLILTGGQNSPGGVYIIRIQTLMQYTLESDFEIIYRNPNAGFMVPAVLSDINGDNIEDIIVASFNSTIYAFNGKTYEIIWTYTFATSETVSSIVPGHFDNDNCTDFMVKYNSGPGFPIYYYSQTTILNGLNGESLLDQMIKDSGGPYSLLAGLSISQTFGGDLFLHWQTQCRDKYEQTDAYQFIPESDIIQQSRADTCMLRFNTSTVLKLYAIARHIKPPGGVIFSTDDLILQLNQTELEQMTRIATSSAVRPLKHPKMIKKLPKLERIGGNELNYLNSLTNTDNNLIVGDDEMQKKKINKLSNHVVFSEEKNNLVPLSASSSKINQQFVYPKRIYESDQLQSQPNQEDFDNYFNYDPAIEISQRMKYLSSRDIKNKPNTDDNEILNIVENNLSDMVKSPLLSKSDSFEKEFSDNKANHSETLWDLEFEKETEEAKDTKTSDYGSRLTRNNDINQNVLASISNTGTLCKPLDDSPSGVDYIFVLNVRESEIYPPLLLQQDLACVEDKITGYKSFPEDDIIALERQFLKQCIQNRLPNLRPHNPLFESQIIVTRISITCNCGTELKDGEICSKLNPIEKQKWTSFMGKNRNGVYSHL